MMYQKLFEYLEEAHMAGCPSFHFTTFRHINRSLRTSRYTSIQRYDIYPFKKGHALKALPYMIVLFQTEKR